MSWGPHDKAPQPGGLKTQSPSRRSGGWKSPTEVSAGWLPSEAAREGSVPPWAKNLSALSSLTRAGT